MSRNISISDQERINMGSFGILGTNSISATMNSKKTYIKVNLSQELKDEFRLVCAAEGITITSKMIFLMRQEVEKNKNLIKEAKKLKGSEE